MLLSQKLKDSVIFAAISGKLTNQNPKDMSVLKMLEYIKNNNNVNTRSYFEITKEPFPIPESWRWVHLGEIVEFLCGYSFKSNNYIPQSDNLVIRLGNVKNNELILSAKEAYIPDDIAENTIKFLIHENDILITMTGTKGKKDYFYSVKVTSEHLNNKNLYLNQRVGCLRTNKYISSDWLCYVLQSDEIKREIFKKETGSANQGNLGAENIKEYVLVPLPPIEEQQRIVNFLNVLFAKIEEYKEIEQQLYELKANFPFDMKNALLQAAMQGKLTKHLKTDSSVETALKMSRIEKIKVCIRKETKYPQIDDKEIPYDLPDSWKWVRLRDCVYNREQKTPDCQFSYIDIGSIDNIHQQLNDSENIIDAINAPSRARKVVKLGDVLYATVRPYLHNMCIVDREFSCEPIASTGFAVMACHSCILNKFLLYYLQSPLFDKYANATDNAKGVAYPSINDRKLYAGLIPIPPIEEQQRIIRRLDALLPLCMALKNT